MKVPAWKQSEVFPIIARIIGEEFVKHQRHITAHEITTRLMAHAEARTAIESAQQKQPDWSVEHTASNMVAWFSQRMTVQESKWDALFHRTKIDGQWAYRPSTI